MSQWPSINLEAICRPKQWPTIPKLKFLPSGYPVFGANGVIGHYCEYNHEDPTILITCRGATCGSLNVCEPKSYVTGNAMALDSLDEKQADLRYLFRALEETDFSSVITGVAQPQITRQSLARLQIPLPPLEEQKRIAAILDAADDLRAKRRESLAQLDALLQSTFLDMFGDPVTNPMGWEAPTLGELINVKSGDGLVAKDMAPHGVYPVYGGNGINGYHDEYMFEKPKIVLGRVGVYCGAVHLTKPKAWVTDNALYVRELLQPVETTYLIEALRIANLNQYANQAAQPLISGSRIYPVTILLPPIDLQRRFASIVVSVEKQKAKQCAHLDELDTLFASLQSRAFRGEL